MAIIPPASTHPPRWLAALLPLLLLAPVAAGAQREEEAKQHGIFIDTIDVNIINIEVMAFDQKGDPVTGLTREDFELYEDGEPIEITNFFAVENGLRLLPAPRDEGETEPEEPAPPPARRADELRHVVLLVDDGNISSLNRKRVFGQLYDHLEQIMGPADRVMVVSQDSEVSIEQPFTSDVELVQAALRRLEDQVGTGAMRTVHPRVIQRQIEQGQAPPGGDALATGTTVPSGGPLARPTFDVDARSTYSEVSSYAHSTQQQVHRTMVVMGRFIDSLAGLPGRKAVVYVSDGLELRPGEFLFRIWDYKYNSIAAEMVGITNIDSEIERYALGSEFQRLIGRANANRVTFYTIEGGDQEGFSVSAETRSLVVDPLARTADGERESSLRTLAAATGGVPILNGASLENLADQLEKDLSTYYSLGYPSPHRGDGEYHRVEVKVRRPGIRLRYLEGYRDKSSDERMVDQTLASLLHDAGANPLGIEIEVGEPERGGESQDRKGRDTKGKGLVVPVMVKIPLSKLVLLPQETTHLGRLSIFVAVRDEKGRLSEPQKIDLPVEIPNDQLLTALSQMAGYAARLQMRPGSQKIAVAVRDELGAVSSTVNLNVEIGG